ncbi:MAG: NAD-dependent epimerase/dehydratase family protein [Bacteriovoracaceae bacterium]
MTNKILLTGAAGFIASSTAKLLLDNDFEVIGIDHLNDYYDVGLKEYRLAKLKKLNGFQFVQLDIENRSGLDQFFRNHNFSAVINLAARAGVRYSIDNPYVYYSTNVLGTLNILECMKENKVRKLVTASTSSLYSGLEMPFEESMPVSTQISPYGASKKAAEVLCYTYHKLYQIDVSILRYFTVYGPAGRPDMSVLRFIKCIDEGRPIEIYGDGTQARDFTYISDIAEGTLKSLKPLDYEIINLGGGQEPTTVLDLIEIIEEKLSKKAIVNHLPFHAADMKGTWANIEKANKHLAWTPKVLLEDGIQKTIDWYNEYKAKL